jgi:amino acid permease
MHTNTRARSHTHARTHAHAPPHSLPSPHINQQKTAMSVLYGVIAIALGALGASNRRGDLTGRPGNTPADKFFGVANSLGTLAFAFSAAIICIEVEHTLREPPRAAVSMRKSIGAAMGTAFTLYALVSILCYSALGPDSPDDVLVGFEKTGFAPLWLAMLANAAVLIHMVAAVQTYMQPIFEWLEDALMARFPKAVGRVPPLAFRVLLRTPLMVVVTLLAIVVPSFSAITGLVGAMTYFPTATFYPLHMYRTCHEMSRRRSFAFYAIIAVMAVISLLATVGAMQGVVVSARNTAASFAG